MMPGMSGYDVCRALRQDHSRLDLPVLMLTAGRRTEDVLLGFDAGANDYVAKPFEKEETAARIKTLLELRRTARELGTALSRLEEYNRTLEERVTDRTRALEEAKSVAERANRAKSDFLTVMSHEIRTAMSGITGMVELLTDEPLSGKQKEYAYTLQESSGMLSAIIDDALDFARIEEGRVTLNSVLFDLCSLKRRVDAVVEPQARKKGLHFVSRVDPEVPMVLRGDPVHLARVLLNLLGNAVKFTEVGQVSLHISLARADGNDATFQFEVCDTGCGIAESVRAGVYDPFVQADISSTRQHGGVGLGLYICKSLVELMNGEISFDSVVGEGTTFRVVLPFAVGSRADLPQDEVDTELSAARLANRRPKYSGRVLVTEDSPVNRLLIVEQLKKLGLDVDVALSGREAVEAASARPYLLIFMDCRMPEMDGLDATRAIRLDEKRLGKRTPIIALTASATSSEREKGLEAGMDDYLSKPVRLVDLCNVIERWAAGSADGRAAASLDTRALSSAAGGDAALVSAAARAFLSDMPVKLAALQEALRREDAEGVCLNAHAMKSSGWIVGATRFASTCRELEDLAATGDLSRAGDLAARAESEYQEVKSELIALLTSGDSSSS